MILQALVALAESERLVADADFEFKPVSWGVILDEDGRLVQIASYRTNLNEGTKRKPHWAGKQVLVPRQPIRTSGALAFLLVDKSEYALGFDPSAKRDLDQLAERAELFREQVQSCAERTGDPVIAAVQKFLTNLSAYRDQIAKSFLEDPWEANELFAFRVGADPIFVHQRPAMMAYWKSIRAAPSGGKSAAGFHCLVTGAPVNDVRLMPLIKRVPGGTPSGVSLVSFNASAFESFGLAGNENAPISQNAAELATTALNRLLDDRFPDPNDPERLLASRNVKVSGDTVTCFWSTSRDENVTGWLDRLANLIQGASEETVGEFYRSVWTGEPVTIRDRSDFYVLVLSGTQGRAVVRDWIETTLSAAIENLTRHFSDLSIVRRAIPKAGLSAERVIPLRRLIDSLAAEGNSEQIPGSIESGIIRAAFTGAPYPFQILQRALLRERAEAGRSEWLDSARRDARASLIKAVLNRRRREPQAENRYPEIPMSLNPSLQSEGYSLGMLMAVLERLQQAALGDVNASVVDRYFASASATPRAVFVRLIKNSQHHARKAADSDERAARGFAQRLKRLIDFILTRFDINPRQYPPRSSGLPSHLDLEQQGLFVIGYHQMRYWLWMSKEERAKWESEHPDLPGAFRSSQPGPAEGPAEETVPA